MENETTESQSRNAAKVAGLAAAITLTGVLAVKAKRFVGRKLAARKPKNLAIKPEVVQ